MADYRGLNCQRLPQNSGNRFRSSRPTGKRWSSNSSNREAFTTSGCWRRWAKCHGRNSSPQNLRGKSYSDSALPIGHDQTISQPFIVAFMTEQLRLQPTDRVLEVGTGSGYQAAVLAELVKEVYSIEIIEPLAKKLPATTDRDLVTTTRT